jgi:hypothetical protein
MKLLRNLALLATVIAIAPGSLAAADDNKPLYTIVISTPQSTVKVGEPVRIHVVLTNISAAEISLSTDLSVHCDYSIQVEAPDGSSSKNSACTGGSSRSLRLKPGDQFEDDETLTNIYQLDQHGEDLINTLKTFPFAAPGKYTVQLSQHISGDPKSGVVRSNKITITVIPGGEGSSLVNMPDFSISIGTPNDTIKVGEDVRIHAALTNISNHEVTVPDLPEVEEGAYYFVWVKGPKGEFGRAGGADGADKILKPGEQIQEVEILKDFPIDFSTPGVYVIQFFRHNGDDPNPYAVKSNKLTITVTE